MVQGVFNLCLVNVSCNLFKVASGVIQDYFKVSFRIIFLGLVDILALEKQLHAGLCGFQHLEIFTSTAPDASTKHFLSAGDALPVPVAEDISTWLLIHQEIRVFWVEKWEMICINVSHSIKSFWKGHPGDLCLSGPKYRIV